MKENVNTDDDKRKSISKQLISLISQGHELTSITIKELTGIENISRSSFYNYFSDVYDLLNWIYYNELLVWFDEFLKNEMHREGFKLLYKKIYSNKNFYLNIFKFNREFAIDIYFKNYFYEVFYSYPSKKINPNGLKECELTRQFYANSMSYVLTLWLESGCTISIEEILEFSIYTRHTTLHQMIKRQKQ